MKKYKNAIIVIALVFCGILGWRYYEEQKMLHLHHTYEVSLAKALKNSYKDIEEIHFDNPYYSDKSGSWGTDVVLVFSDGIKIEYRTYHSMHETTNHSPSVGGKHASEIIDSLDSRVGKTTSVVKVYYSNKQTEEIK